VQWKLLFFDFVPTFLNQIQLLQDETAWWWKKYLYSQASKNSDINVTVENFNFFKPAIYKINMETKTKENIIIIKNNTSLIAKNYFPLTLLHPSRVCA
jgi:hypothetical protein